MGAGLAVSLLLGAVGSIQDASSEPAASFNFSKSYTVWAQGNDGCLYAVYDVFIDRAELKKALAEYQDKKRGVEFLVSKATPAKCVVLFNKAAAKAGFINHRARLATHVDQDANVPPPKATP